DEYRRFIEKEKAIVRRFNVVKVEEPSVEDTQRIITGIKDKYEKYHNVSYDMDALMESVVLAGKYIHDRHFPDKAIDVMDAVAAKARSEANDTTTIQITASMIEEEIANMANINSKKISTSEDEKVQTLFVNLR